MSSGESWQWPDYTRCFLVVDWQGKVLESRDGASGVCDTWEGHKVGELVEKQRSYFPGLKLRNGSLRFFTTGEVHGRLEAEADGDWASRFVQLVAPKAVAS